MADSEKSPSVADELVRELYKLTDPSLVRSKIDSLRNELSIVQKKSAELEAENQRLKQENQELRDQSNEDSDVTRLMEMSRLKSEIDGILNDIKSIQNQKKRVFCELNRQSVRSFEIDRYSEKYQKIGIMDHTLDEQRKKLDDLNAEMNTLKSNLDDKNQTWAEILFSYYSSEINQEYPIQSPKSVIKESESSLMMIWIRNESLHYLWQISMVMRYTFKGYFGESRFLKQGYFVDHQMSHLIHSYSDWTLYPSLSGDRSLPGKTEMINAAVISEDGHYLFAGANNHKIQVWDLVSGKLIGQWYSDQSKILVLDYHRPLLAVGGTMDDSDSGGGVSLLDSYTSEVLLRMHGHDQPVFALAFSDNGDRLISGSQDCSVKVWSVITGELLRNFNAHERAVRAVCTAGDLIVSGSALCMNVWDTREDSNPQRTINQMRLGRGTHGAITDCCLNCDGSLLFCSVHQRPNLVYSWPSLELIKKVEIDSFFTMFHPINPSWLAVTDLKAQTARLLDLNDGICLATFEGRIEYTEDLCFTPCGERLIIVGPGMDIQVWDLSGVQ